MIATKTFYVASTVANQDIMEASADTIVTTHSAYAICPITITPATQGPIKLTTTTILSRKVHTFQINNMIKHVENGTKSSEAAEEMIDFYKYDELFEKL